MSTPRTFSAASQDQTLIVQPLRSVGSLAEEDVMPELHGMLQQLQRGELRNVVVDLGQVSYFGTTMLEAMHALWRRVRDAQGRMALCNVSTMGCEVLRVSGFDTLWPIYASQEEALAAVA